MQRSGAPDVECRTSNAEIAEIAEKSTSMAISVISAFIVVIS